MLTTTLISDEESEQISATFYDEVTRIVDDVLASISSGDSITTADAVKVMQINASSSDLLDNDDGIETILSHVHDPEALAETPLSESGQQFVALACLLHYSLVALKRHHEFRRLPNG